MTVSAPYLADEAEQAALGAALGNEGACTVVCRDLRPADFYRERERRILAAIVDLHTDGRGVDVVSIATQLGADEELRDYLHALVDPGPIAAHVAEYIAAVQDCARRRRLHQAAEVAQLDLAQANGDGVRLFRARMAAAIEAEALPLTAGLCSYTAPEIDVMEFTDPDPVLLYAERGCTFDLVAKAKKGKTTMLLLACKAVLREEPFLDLPTKRVPILYLTEQTRRSFKMKLAAMGLTGESDLHIAFRTDFKGKSWDEICEWIAAEVAKWGIGLLPIDTLSDWAKIRDENDNGEALRVTAPLRGIAEAKNVAVITARHAGKGEHESRDVVDLGRGASAFAGAADVVCTLGSAPGSGHPNRRQLRYEGRPDDLPAAVIIELKDGRYESLGGAPSIEYQTARTFVAEHLQGTESAAITQTNMLNACDGQFSRRTLQRALNDLMAEGVATGRIGAGSASGKAFGYWLLTGGDNAEGFGF